MPEDSNIVTGPSTKPRRRPPGGAGARVDPNARPIEHVDVRPTTRPLPTNPEDEVPPLPEPGTEIATGDTTNVPVNEDPPVTPATASAADGMTQESVVAQPARRTIVDDIVETKTDVTWLPGDPEPTPSHVQEPKPAPRTEPAPATDALEQVTVLKCRECGRYVNDPADHSPHCRLFAANPGTVVNAPILKTPNDGNATVADLLDHDIVVHFVTDGFTAWGKTWYRGQTVMLDRDSGDFKETCDVNGRSWLDMDEATQLRRYKRVIFRPGPWTGLGYEHAEFEDVEVTPEQLAAAAEAERRRAGKIVR